MPPLERFHAPSPSHDMYITVDDNRIIHGVKGDVFESTQIPCKFSTKSDFAVFSQRDVIIGTNPLYDIPLPSPTTASVAAASSPAFSDFESSERRRPYKKQQQQKPPNRFGIDWLNQYFACMCVGPEPVDTYWEEPTSSSPRNVSIITGGSSTIQPSTPRNSTTPTNSKKYIVYPIAKYPARLNSPYLVEQRRRSLMKHLTFQPVVVETE